MPKILYVSDYRKKLLRNQKLPKRYLMNFVASSFYLITAKENTASKRIYSRILLLKLFRIMQMR